MIAEAPRAGEPVSHSISGLRLVLAVLPGPFKDEVIDALKTRPSIAVCDHSNVADLESLPRAIEANQANVLLFDLRCLGALDFAPFIAVLQRAIPRLKVVALHPSDESQLILSAIRAGACEFLHSPVVEMLGPALDRISRSVAAPEPAVERRGKVIGVVAAKGGCGATTIACHLAVELKRQTGQNVLLVDFDFRAGVIPFLMKVSGVYSVLDALENQQRLDADFWKALIIPAKSGISILPAPGSMAHSEPDFREVLRIMRVMRSQHDWIVFDLGHGLSPLTVGLADELDELLLISTLDVTALHLAKAILRDLPPSNRQAERSHLVLNRMQKNSDISQAEIEKIFARRLFAMIPNDYQAVTQAYVTGNLLPADSRMGKYFARLASLVAGVPEPSVKKGFSLFG